MNSEEEDMQDAGDQEGNCAGNKENQSPVIRKKRRVGKARTKRSEQEGDGGDEPIRKKPRFECGDLVWVKDGAEPFWPAMIIRENSTGLFTITYGTQCDFYVMFFGTSNFYAWTKCRGKVYPFEGKEKFYEFIRAQIDRSVIFQRPNLEKKFSLDIPRPGCKQSWDTAVSEAERALGLTRSERIEKIEDFRKIPYGNLLASVCYKCMRGDDDGMQTCVCGMKFHRVCVNSENGEGCTQCTAEVCSICGSDASRAELLTAACCRRLFHVICIERAELSYKLSDNAQFIESCPRHNCVTCRRSLNEQGIEVFRCLRCPAAYHESQLCIPATCKFITVDHLICPRHHPTQDRSPLLTFCYICMEEIDGLRVCSRCPRTFHQSCLGMITSEIVSGEILCLECQRWRFPVFGAVCWAHREDGHWWPATIIHPSESSLAPDGFESRDIVCSMFLHGIHEHARFKQNQLHPFALKDIDKISQLNGAIAESAEFKHALDEATIVHECFERMMEEKRDIQLTAGHAHSCLSDPALSGDTASKSN